MATSTEPRGSINTPTMELGSQNHSTDGLLGPNSIIVPYMDPLGDLRLACTLTGVESGSLACATSGCVAGRKVEVCYP